MAKFLPLVVVLLAATSAEVIVDININVVRNVSAAECTTAATDLNCSTLAAALHLVAEYPNLGSAMVNVTYSHNLTEEITLRDLAIGVLVFTEESGINITCPKLGQGIAFYNVLGVGFVGISWHNCSVPHSTTAYLSAQNEWNCKQAHSALFFYGIDSINIADCHFTSLYGSGVSIYDPGDTVSIASSYFTGHHVSPELDCATGHTPCSPMSVGLYIETTYCGFDCNCSEPIDHTDVVYQILGCTFESNVNLSPIKDEINIARENYREFWPFGSGGGMAMIFRGNFQSNTILIDENIFQDNMATEGGGMALQLYFQPEENSVVMNNSNFTGNHADDSGGGLRLGLVFTETGNLFKSEGQSSTVRAESFYATPPSSSSVYPNESSVNRILMNNIRFLSNTAFSWGGGMSAYSSMNSAKNFDLNMTMCTWTNNSASVSAAALGLTRWQEQAKFTAEQMNATSVFPFCSDCTFQLNKIKTYTNQSYRVGYGTVFLQGIPMAFHSASFINNSESALCISSTFAQFSGVSFFIYNSGFVGGGIYMLGMSHILLTPHVNVIFINNTAFQHGGGLFYMFPPPLSLSSFGNCFIKYKSSSGTDVDYKDWTARVIFVYNSAIQGGNDVYVSTPSQCTFNNSKNPFNIHSSKPVFIYNISKASDVEKAVNTPPYCIKFKLNITNGTWYTYEVQPGAFFNISLQVLDFFSRSTVAIVSIRCHTIEDYNNYHFNHDRCIDGNFSLPGGSGTSREFTVKDSLNSLQLMGMEGSQIVLVLKTSGLQPVVVPLLVKLKKCDFGYLFDESTKSCKCFAEKLESTDVLCYASSNEEQVCIRNGYWFGEVANTADGLVYGVQTCTADTCRDDCTQCGHLSGWCVLPAHSDKFCESGRGGALCSQCQDNLTLSYDSFYCVACSPGKTVGLVLVFIAYWAAVLVEVMIIMKLDFRIGSGATYCFLYYFSVVQYVLYYNVPKQVDFLLKVFGSLARLDPLFLVYSRLCFYPGITSLQYEMIHFIHPTVVILTILGLILLSKVCPRVDVFSGRSAVQALCFVFILAYTTIAETTFNIVNPMHYLATNSSTPVTAVLVQPYTPYFHRTEHLPYFIVAVLMEAVIVLPFAFFMLVAPWLSRCFNMIKIKPILDEYQSCYKSDYRWFAGVYLISREVFFVTSFWIIDVDIGLLLNQVVCVCVLLLHASFQPYQKTWLNILDTIFLFDLTVLSLLYANTGVVALNFQSQGRNAFITILILVPSLYAFFGVAWEVLKMLSRCGCCHTARGRMRLAMSRWTSTENTMSDVEDSLPSRLLDEETQHRSRSYGTGINASVVPGNDTRPLLESHRASSDSDGSSSERWYQRIGNLVSRRRSRDSPPSGQSMNSS